MTKLEQLENEAYENNIDIVDYPFRNQRIKGLYCDGTVALNHTLENTTERKCILAEELGHHYTASGNILGNGIASAKQEARGRIFAYNKLIGLSGLISAYKFGCKSLYEVSEYLDVTESFLSEALANYRQKYGVCATVDNYVIYFEPYLTVYEIV